MSENFRVLKYQMMNSVLKPQDNSPPISLRVDVQRDTKAIVFCNLQLLQQLVFFGLFYAAACLLSLIPILLRAVDTDVALYAVKASSCRWSVNLPVTDCP